MMPPSLHYWLTEDHSARFVADMVPSLELSEFYASYEEKDGRGQAAYHPVMMVRLLIYGYSIGVVSSRQIEKRTYEDVAFRYLSADEHPDHTTINEFRKRRPHWRRKLDGKPSRRRLRPKPGLPSGSSKKRKRGRR